MATSLDEVLEALGFEQVGEVIEGRMSYRDDAAALCGTGGAVYVFSNPDGRAWKVGQTSKGFTRINYTRVLDGRAMKRPHEQTKLEAIRRELADGATQWVVRTDQPELVEAMLAVVLEPTESRRAISSQEKALRNLLEGR